MFDNIDEVKTAIKIARKLLEDGENSDDILIVASDIQEYAPIYKLFLDEYEIKGYSSIGTPLSSFFNSNNQQVQIALNNYNSKIQSLETLYNKLGLELKDTTKQNIKSSISILDNKIGIELTEPNQIVGLSKKYKHTIFIGTDINHFPPKSNDNFLYSYDDDLKYFYANNYFTSSATQLNELKRLSENLYIITASYSGKRELTQSILIDNKFDDTINISKIKTKNDIALQNQSTIKIDKKFYTNIQVDGIKATHLSASQINSYLACPLRYLYSNKIKVQSPSQNEEGFDVMEQGSLMHLCYELFGKKIKENHITDTDQEYLYNIMYEVSIEAYNHKDTVEPRGKDKLVKNIHHKIFLSSLQAGLKDDRDAGLLAKFVDYYM
ncbi:MAG: PD-(D/E)XK nuclease family protein [Campylobacterota bacterium]|nr:PD-(D/E)XK nuclease family protein [Campylobacterota bacterium]